MKQNLNNILNDYITYFILFLCEKQEIIHLNNCKQLKEIVIVNNSKSFWSTQKYKFTTFYFFFKVKYLNMQNSIV